MAKRKHEKANYDFSDQKEPKHRMGQKGFANLPDRPILKKFSSTHNYRSGVPNDFSCGLEDISGIEENRSGTY